MGHNPRYAVSNPAADPRAHVFAWDVSLAMECEIPHNRGGREMTLAQTVDWVRFECTYRGWRKLDATSAITAADRGELVSSSPRIPRCAPWPSCARAARVKTVSPASLQRGDRRATTSAWQRPSARPSTSTLTPDYLKSESSIMSRAIFE